MRVSVCVPWPLPGCEKKLARCRKFVVSVHAQISCHLEWSGPASVLKGWMWFARHECVVKTPDRCFLVVCWLLSCRSLTRYRLCRLCRFGLVVSTPWSCLPIFWLAFLASNLFLFGWCRWVLSSVAVLFVLAEGLGGGVQSCLPRVRRLGRVVRGRRLRRCAGRCVFWSFCISCVIVHVPEA